MTCEHASNHVPANYAHLFRGARRALDSHRGYDAGALTLARNLAAALRAPLLAGTATRLLADLNRHETPAAALSEYSRRLAPEGRTRMLRRWHTPYRERAERRLRGALDAGRGLVHVSCHSFTPRLRGELRRADIGLLYDPKRRSERELVADMRQRLLERWPRLRIRRNYPYRGVDDGLTSHLRRLAPDSCYAGIEIEINQRWVRGAPARWARLRAAICAAAAAAIAAIEPPQNVPR